jgi:hypothetical protein
LEIESLINPLSKRMKTSATRPPAMKEKNWLLSSLILYFPYRNHSLPVAFPPSLFPPSLYKQSVSRDINGVWRDAFSSGYHSFSVDIESFCSEGIPFCSEVTAFSSEVTAFCYKLRAFLFNLQPFFIHLRLSNPARNPARCVQTCTFMVDMGSRGKVSAGNHKGSEPGL